MHSAYGVISEKRPPLRHQRRLLGPAYEFLVFLFR